MPRIVLPIICMCVSMCQSFTMLAQNAVEVTYSNKTIFYDNFTDAFKEANKSDGAYLKLLEDVSFEGEAPSFSVTKQMTIDLNGHSLGDTLTKANLIEVNADTAVLRLTSSQTGGKIIAIRDYKWKIAAIDVKQGRLEAENITIETSNLRSYSNEGQSAAAAPINVASIGAISVKNCVLKAQADSYPYGISSSSTKEACPDIELKNSSILSQGKRYVYGIKTFPKTLIDNCKIDIESDSTFVYGIHIGNFTDSINFTATPVPTISNVCINIKGKADRIYTIFSNSNINLISDTINAEGSRSVFGVYCNNSATVTKSKVNVTSSDKTAYALYMSNDTANAVVSDCHFTAEAGYTSATALYIQNGSLFTRNSLFEAISRLDTATVLTDASTAAMRLQHPDAVSIIKNCKLSAQAPKPDFSRNAVGIQLSGKADIDSCEITAMAGYTNSYAISLLSTAELNLKNSHLKSNANLLVYGILANGNAQNTATMSVDNCQIEVEGDDNYGIQAYSKLEVLRSKISALSVSKTARGIVVNNYFDSIQNVNVAGRVSDVRIDVSSQMSAVGIISKGAISLDNDTLSVVADSTASGLHLINTADIDHCEVFVSAKRHKAYGIEQYDTAVIRNSTITAISKEQNANAVSPYATSSTTLYDCRLKTSAATDSAMIGRTYNFAGTIVLHNGYYSNDENIRGFLPSDTYAVYAITEGKEYNEGYRFIIRPISDPEMDIAYIYDDRQTLKAQFAHVEEALEYVNKLDEELTIVVRGTSILPKGKYHIPKKTTLLVPFFAEQKSAIGNIAMRNTEKTQPTEYVRLILSDSVFITVDGAIELSGIQCAKGTQSAYPIGNYGHIFIPESSEIVLNDNSELRAWGYITGSGNIIAKTGSRVYENLQLGDWKGGALTISIMHNYQRVFPISHYFYQNIECLITYHSGAEAFASTSNIVNGVTMMGDDIRIVGTGNSLFNMKENTTDWIQKKYEPQTDRLTWITNGDVALEKLAVKMLSEEISIEISSDEYVLPIPTNMSIVCQSGNFDFSHDAVFLPSSEMIVAHNAHVNIPDSVGVYLYGADEIEECFGKRYNTVAYSPSWTQCPRDSVLKPALCNIEGIVDVYGNLFSTDSGADVVGNNDKGQPKIVFHTPAEMDYIYQIVGDRDDFSFKAKRVTSTPLTNADGTRVQTKESIDYEEDIFIPEEYNYINGEWILNKQNIGTINIENTLSRPNNKTKVMIEKGIMYLVLPDGKLITTLGTRMQK